MEDTYVHLDGDQSLVYITHMVLAFLCVPKPLPWVWRTSPQAFCQGWRGRSGGVPYSMAFLSPRAQNCSLWRDAYSCLIIIINKYVSGGHRANSPGLRANIQSSTGPGEFWWQRPLEKPLDYEVHRGREMWLTSAGFAIKVSTIQGRVHTQDLDSFLLFWDSNLVPSKDSKWKTG